jgi:5-aminolevulinate synthase
MLYQDKFKKFVENIKNSNNYRFFKNIKRSLDLPYALDENDRKITIWCSNDYLGLTKHPQIIKNSKDIIDELGVGSGGTRNIAGSHSEIVKLEKAVASLQRKDSALIFNSGYVANRGAITAIGKIFPDIIFISDELNHASIIDGIRSSLCNKVIFKHNDVDDLRSKLLNIDKNIPKMIIIEGLYSMNGDFPPLPDIVSIAKEFNAMTYIDEVHSNGIYGENGSGVAEKFGLQNEIDIIQGNFGKAFGSFGGYIAANGDIVDAIRLISSDFIFTTSLPPVVVSANLFAIDLVSRDVDNLRQRLFDNVIKLKKHFRKSDISFIDNESHMVIVMINDAIKVRKVCDELFDKYRIYIQGINFPTVPIGSERLRITITPQHSESDIINLCIALKDVLQ